MKKILLLIVLTYITYSTVFAIDVVVDTTWVQNNINNKDVVFLDVRNEKSYQKGHIPNAIHIDYAQWRVKESGVIGLLPPQERVQELIRNSGIDSSSHVVVVSGVDNKDDFGKAARIYWTLKVAGISDVSLLDGGYARWVKVGGEISTVATRAIASTYTIAEYDTLYLALEEDVQNAIKNESVLLIDARPKSFFDGFKKHSAARIGGTIKSSKNISQFDFINADGTLISKEEAQALLDAVNGDGIDTIISFCNTGHWAATNWFIFSEYLGETSTLYDGSLVEWTLTKSNQLDNVKSRKELRKYQKEQNKKS